MAANAVAVRGLGLDWRALSGATAAFRELDEARERRERRREGSLLALGNAGRAMAAAFLAASSVGLFEGSAARRCAEDLVGLAAKTRPLLVSFQNCASIAFAAVHALPQLREQQRRRPILAGGATPPPPDRPHMRLERVAHQIGRAARLEADLDVPWGTHACVCGPSGVGKTTLLALLRGTLAPGEGRVLWGGADAAALGPAALRALVCSGGQASASAFLDGTVREALLAGCGSHCGHHAAVTDREAEELLRRVGLCTASLSDSAGALSGGERQRVALARALFHAQEKVLFMDEPFSALDEEAEMQLLRVMLDARPGQTVLLVTHRPAVAALFPRRLLLSSTGAEGSRTVRCAWE